MYQYYCTACKETFLENELTDNESCPRCGDDGLWEREVPDDLNETLKDICRSQGAKL